MGLLKFLVPPAFYPKPPEPKATLATLTTPDQIILAHVLNSLVMNYEDWTVSGDLTTDSYEFTTDATHPDNRTSEIVRSSYLYLVNSARKIEFDLSLEAHLGYPPHRSPRDYRDRKLSRFSLNRAILRIRTETLEFNKVEDILPIFQAVRVHQKQAIERAKMLEQMKEDERKWNLAEQLTGLARTEAGALVPRYKVPDDRRCLCNTRNPNKHAKKCPKSHDLKCECKECLTDGVSPMSRERNASDDQA